MNTVCYICLSPISNNLSLKPCKHCFCSQCILPWLRNSQTCPTCCQLVQGSKHDDVIEQRAKTLNQCSNGCGEYLLPDEVVEHNQFCIRKPANFPQSMTIAEVLTKIDQGYITESISFLTFRIKDNHLSLNEKCQSKYILVKVFKKLGLYQKALETLDLCQDLSKTIRLFHLAEIHRKLEHFAESELNYTKHLEIDPNHALSYRGLALINKKRRHYNDAFAQIQIAISKSLPNTQQYNILKVDRADIYRKMTKYNEAEVELLSVINDEDSRRKLTGLEMADALYSLVVLFIDQQKANDQTLKYLQTAQNLYRISRCDIKSAMCNFLNGRILLQMGKFDSCFQSFLEGIDYFERNKITSLELADGYCDFASAVIYSTSEDHYSKAKKFISDAQQIYRDTYPNGHDKIQLCDNLLILFEPF